MELDRDRIADIAQRHGVDEREALILYHLGHAFELYFEIAKEEDYGYDVNLKDWVDHHTGLINLLMRRVVRRDHPGGWRTGVMQDVGYESPRRPLSGNLVNRGLLCSIA